MKFGSKFFSIFAGMICATFLASGVASLSITNSALAFRTPDATSGRVIPERMKGVVVYPTAQQRDWYHLANSMALLCFVTMLVLLANKNKIGLGTERRSLKYRLPSTFGQVLARCLANKVLL